MSERGWIIPIGGAEEKLRDPVILRRFVDLCGGSKARIAVIPTASQMASTGPKYVSLFEELGAAGAVSLPYANRNDCQREDWLADLAEADGIFLTGGNQLRLSTVLGGTPVGQTIRDRNAEGVHVAGTSAGAAIMSTHMIAFGDEGATPRADIVTLSPGLGLTPRIVVDQHFRQRDRLGRLVASISYNPWVIGLGLDEDTAAFLNPDEEIEVVGSGGITVVDSSQVEYSSMGEVEHHMPVSIIGLKLHILVSGGRFNTITRKASH